MLKKFLVVSTIVSGALFAEGETIEPAQSPVQQEPAKAAPAVTQEDIDKVSEAFGHFVGKNLAAPGLDLNIEQVIKGIRDGASGKPAPMSDEDYQAKMLAVQTQSFQKLSDKNLKDASDYLEKNSKEANVKEVVPGKLQVLVLQEGTGGVVAEKSTPEIKYSGKFIDGQVFGSSDQSGGSLTIPLEQTIPGLSKALVGMKEGEKARIFVHPELGYGTAGQLPPNSLLIFDIEIIKADNKEKAAPLIVPEKVPEEDKGDVKDSDDDEFDGDEEDEEEEAPSTSGFSWPKW